jgi:hypothetical protein
LQRGETRASGEHDVSATGAAALAAEASGELFLPYAVSFAAPAEIRPRGWPGTILMDVAAGSLAVRLPERVTSGRRIAAKTGDSLASCRRCGDGPKG